jgi:hypothetical protein
MTSKINVRGWSEQTCRTSLAGATHVWVKSLCWGDVCDFTPPPNPIFGDGIESTSTRSSMWSGE